MHHTAFRRVQPRTAVLAAGAAAVAVAAAILGWSHSAGVSGPGAVSLPSLSAEENALFNSGIPLTVTIDPADGRITSVVATATAGELRR